MARGKSVAAAKEEMPVPESDIDVPPRANIAMMKKTLVAEWNIDPGGVGDVSMSFLQDVKLAQRAESYIQHEQHQQTRGGGMKSERDSDSYKDYKERMNDQFGGVQ